MQDWNTRFLLVALPVIWVISWFGIAHFLAVMSGWKRLTNRFRLNGEFAGSKWSFQSARMRFGTNYNGCLTVGANNAGLYARPMLLLHLGHPALFVPWPEITATARRIWFWDAVEYRLGREEQIPFTVRLQLAEKIRAAAASQTGAPMPIN